MRRCGSLWVRAILFLLKLYVQIYPLPLHTHIYIYITYSIWYLVHPWIHYLLMKLFTLSNGREIEVGHIMSEEEFHTTNSHRHDFVNFMYFISDTYLGFHRFFLLVHIFFLLCILFTWFQSEYDNRSINWSKTVFAVYNQYLYNIHIDGIVFTPCRKMVKLF